MLRTPRNSGVPSITALGILCFLLAAVTGIWRIALLRGFYLPAIPDAWPPHGHWMVAGFLAAMIMGERLTVLPVRYLAWVPIVYVLTALVLHTGNPFIRIIHMLALFGWWIHRWHAFRMFHVWTIPFGEAVALTTLTVALYTSRGLATRPDVALAGLAFPVTVIALERMAFPLRAGRPGAILAFLGLMLWCGMWMATVLWGPFSMPRMGLLTTGLVIGVAWNDTAVRALLRSHRNRRVPIGLSGLHDTLRWTLAVAYGWWFLAATAMIRWPHMPATVAKDVTFHALGLGMIFTMILAHAPIMLPAMLKKPPVLNVPIQWIVLFQWLTVGRVTADLFMELLPTVWRWTGWLTGMLHTAVFLIYLATIRIRITKNVNSQF